VARHPFLRANAPRWEEERSWRAGEAELVLVRASRPASERTQLAGVGSPAALASLVAEAAPVAAGRAGFALLTRGTWELVPDDVRAAYGLAAGRGWDWMWAAAPAPVQPGEERVSPVRGPAAEAEVRDCLARAYPEAHADPADPALLWWGFRDDGGTLRGVVATAAQPGSGVHVSGLGTDRTWRRRGVAGAMMAAVTRWALADHPYVHYGIWADNDAARRVYTRLGHAVGHEIENVVPGG
jgi:ribosomal protein S18 acetylase RimI-like enzyme